MMTSNFKIKAYGQLQLIQQWKENDNKENDNNDNKEKDNEKNDDKDLLVLSGSLFLPRFLAAGILYDRGGTQILALIKFNKK